MTAVPVSKIELKPTRRRVETLQILGLIGPTALYLLLFFVFPLLIVFVYSFLKRGVYGQLVWEFNVLNYVRVFDTLYLSILWRSFVLALLNTLVCLVLAYPFAYYIARVENARTRNLLLVLIMVPFWTNFLIRTYAWRVILANDGPINLILLNTGLISQPLQLIFTNFAVVVGLVYGYLPFMVLPLYAAIERIDFSLMEAASDLYANGWQAFRKVLFPLSMPGVIAGSILVFIPSLGAFVTPDLLGGAKTVMIGNLIQGQFLTSRDWPFGSAFSVLLMLMVLGATLIYFRKGGRTL
ncbi:MAG: ABC transporter permease [Caldilineaceae bacterium]|nr:ABC transporter permease [Caldilineaceae bacterium]MCB9147668.1 ABC transporter permease [Caldilineaceae bacterium]